MVYGIVAVPTKPVAGVNVTVPLLASSAQTPSPATFKLVCWPAVVGSRSIVLGCSVASPNAVSLAAGTSATGLVPVVVVLSELATGGAGGLTVTERLAWFEIVS